MRAAKAGEVDVVGVAVEVLPETLVVAVADDVAEGSPCISPAASTAS